MDKKMQQALEADGAKLKALTGEDHGPVFPVQDWLLNERIELNKAVESASGALREASVQIRELQERIRFLEIENEKLRLCSKT